MRKLLGLLLAIACVPAFAGDLGNELRALAAKVDVLEAKTCPAPIVCPAPVVCPTCPVCPKPTEPPVTGLAPALKLLSNDAIPTATITKPARGASYRDPTYGTPVWRATAPADAGATWTRHIYSRQQAFNADGTRYLAQGSNGALVVYDAATYRPLRTLAGLSGSMEPLWHATDPKLILHGGKGMAGGVFRWHNTDTGVSSSAFTVTAPFITATHYRTRGEGTLSADGKVIALMAERGDTFVGLVSVEVATGRILGSLPAGSLGRPDHVSISPSGRWVVPSWHNANGTRAYSQDFKTFKQLHSSSTHSDLAIGPEGNDYYVFADYSDATGGWVRATNIDTGVSFPLLGLYPGGGQSTAIHISGQAFKRPGWVTFSTYADRGGTNAIYKKVMVAELKPSGRIFNAVHIRNTATGYWAEAHASPNLDLTRILFATNLGSGQFDSYSVQVDWK